MNGYQIQRIFLTNPSTKLIYNGVHQNKSYLFDLNQKETSLTVIYTNKKNTLFGHWVLLYRCGGFLYFFDSLAKCPEFYGGVLKFFHQQFSGCMINVLKNPLQASGSFTCGGYVIYFGFFLSKKYNISQMLEIFSGNLKKMM